MASPVFPAGALPSGAPTSPVTPLEDLLAEVGREVARAEAKHAPMNSAHEGYAVLLEEVDELWEEVRKQTRDRSPEAMRTECVQIAAMAVRFVRDVCERRGRR